MKRLILSSLTLITFFCPANGEIEADIAKAAVIENSVQRLAAYDAIAQKYKLTPQTETAKSTSQWKISFNTSPVDDSKSAFAYVKADQEVGSGYRAYTPTFYIRYKEGQLDAFINTDDFLGMDSMPVTTRIDKQPAATENWSISTDHKAIFRTGNVFNFVNTLDGADTYLVRLTPHSESPITFSFTITGIDEVKAAIRKAME